MYEYSGTFQVNVTGTTNLGADALMARFQSGASPFSELKMLLGPIVSNQGALVMSFKQTFQAKIDLNVTTLTVYNNTGVTVTIKNVFATQKKIT